MGGAGRGGRGGGDGAVGADGQDERRRRPSNPAPTCLRRSTSRTRVPIQPSRASSLGMRRLVLLLVVLTAGCGSTTKVQLECPSPDGMLMAVLFYHSGGGAA